MEDRSKNHVCACVFSVLGQLRFWMDTIGVARWNGLKILIPKHMWKSKIQLLQQKLDENGYVTFFQRHPVSFQVNVFPEDIWWCLFRLISESRYKTHISWWQDIWIILVGGFIQPELVFCSYAIIFFQCHNPDESMFQKTHINSWWQVFWRV